MSLHKLYPIILAAAAVLAVNSCKEEDEITSYPYLDGTLTINAPEFIEPNQTITLTPKGVTHPEGKGIGYSWKVTTPCLSYSDTTRLENGLDPDTGKKSDGTFSYDFTDSLGTYNVSCYAFAAQYTSSLASSYITIVKGGLNGTITGTGITPIDKKVDAHGTSYYYTTYNGIDWFRNNLANPASGVSYSNYKVMRTVLGNFYSYEEAMKACPEGWRLPTDAEWTAFANSLKSGSAAAPGDQVSGVAAHLMADVKFNGTQMWEYWPSVGVIDNSSKFAAVPAGYSNLGEKDGDSYPTASFSGIYEYSVFWTADKVEGEENMAYYRYIIVDQPDLYIGKGDVKSFGATVRCVRAN
jgi:uncharacterized protein (TIGR02145 family)